MLFLQTVNFSHIWGETPRTFVAPRPGGGRPRAGCVRPPVPPRTHLLLQLGRPGVQQPGQPHAVGQRRPPPRRLLRLGLPRGVGGQRGGGGPRQQQEEQQRRQGGGGGGGAEGGRAAAAAGAVAVTVAVAVAVLGKLHGAAARLRLRPRPLLVGEAGGLNELRASLNVYLSRGLRDYSWPGKIRHENTGVCRAAGLPQSLRPTGARRDCETGPGGGSRERELIALLYPT